LAGCLEQFCLKQQHWRAFSNNFAFENRQSRMQIKKNKKTAPINHKAPRADLGFIVVALLFICLSGVLAAVSVFVL
jgi:hypothetical protein